MHGYSSVAQGWQYFTELAQLVAVPPPQQAGFPIVPVLVTTVIVVGGIWLATRKKKR
jgi:hypothetical protein